MNRSRRDKHETPAKRGFHGDGGNRTHAKFPPSEDQQIFLLSDGYEVLVDPDTSLVELSRWTWRLQPANTRSKKRYVARHTTVDGKHQRVFLHRWIMGLACDDPRRIDHVNGDTLDNRRSNLRIATVAQNAQNQGSRGGSSRFRGVTWDKSRQKWMATGMLDGRRRTIGRFNSEDEANVAAMAWRAQHMPYSQEAA